MYDILIKGGKVVDGECDKGYMADVAVVGDKVVKIGNLDGESAKKYIDASGKVVAPGFIDMHTHSDMSLVYDRRASSKIYDGVTTEVVGNCGIGVAPVSEEQKAQLIAYLGTRLIGTIPVKLELPWNTVEEYQGHLSKNPPAVNAVTLVAQGAVRINEMGFAPGKPTAEQMGRMKAEVTKAMELGCPGLSTGLVYMPGEYSSTEELAELTTAVAPFGGFYVTHVRNESDTLFETIDEAIEIATKAGTALHVSHLKLSGPKVFGRTDELFAKIAKTRANGLDMTFDVYPYSSGCTSLGACISPWAFEGGTDKMLERIKDPAMRKRIIKDIEEGIPGWQNFAKAVGSWENITYAATITEEGKALLGKTIAQVAEEMGKSPYDVMFDTLIQESGRIQILVKTMKDEDVEKIVSHPDSMIGSDGMCLSTEGILSTGSPHPRAFGTHGRILSHFVREKKLFTLEEAIKKFAAKPAARLRLDRRGLLKEGYFADIVIFDPETVRDMATYADPKQYTRGIYTVIVNGDIAVDGGVQANVFSGRVIGAAGK